MEGRRNEPRYRVRRAGDWRRSLASSLWAGLILLAAVLYSQKAQGGFVAPRSAFSACLVSFLALGPSLIAFSLCRAPGPRARTPLSRLVTSALTIAPPLALGVAFLPADSSFGIWFLASLFGATGLVLALKSADHSSATAVPAGVPSFGRNSTRNGFATSGSTFRGNVPAEPPENNSACRDDARRELRLPGFETASSNAGRRASAAAFAETGGRPLAEALAPAPERIPIEPRDVAPRDAVGFSQQLVRSSTPSGGDVLEGSVKVTFAAGQKQANVHIPFVPPFATVPSVECEMLEGCDVRLNVGTVQTFGTRIEVKRIGPTDAESSTEIAFAATTAAPQSHAA